VSEIPGPTLEQARHMALTFIDKRGSDCIGVIDSEEKLAAAMIYEGLKRDGLLLAAIGDEGPVYRVTPKGRAAIRSQQGDVK